MAGPRLAGLLKFDDCPGGGGWRGESIGEDILNRGVNVFGQIKCPRGLVIVSKLAKRSYWM